MPKLNQGTANPSQAPTANAPVASIPPPPEPISVDVGLADTAATKATAPRSRETKREQLERLADTFIRIDAAWYPEEHAAEFGREHVHLTENEANNLAEVALKELGQIIGREIDMTAERATFQDYADTCKRLAAKGPGRK